MKSEILHQKIEYPDMRTFIERIGETYAGRTAYSFRRNPKDAEVVHVRYEELREDVRALGTALLARGYAGKHCAVVGRLSYAWVCCYYAIISIGAVLVPLDRDWTVPELTDTLRHADASMLLCDGDLAENGEKICETLQLGKVYLLDGEGENSVSALIREGKEALASGDRRYYETVPDPEGMSLLVFTSGTTGKGKGVMLSQRAVIEDLTDVVQYIDFTDKSVGVLPPHHTYGSSVNIFGHNCIGCEIYLSGGLRYILKELKEQKPGHLVLVPLYLETFYRKILAGVREQGKEKLFLRMIKASNLLRKAGIDLRRKLFASILNTFGGELRMIVTGGAAINQEILYLFDSIGISVLNGYGITECAPIIAVNRSRHVVPGSVGPVLDIDTVRIADPNEDGEGEICVKGPNVMLGYYKDEAATAAAFDEEGYFRTGDYGRLDGDGILYITGRLKNLIILSNGKNVYPEEIESEFVSVPGVQDIVVYEGQSRRGSMYNTIVAEIYPDKEYIEKNGITDIRAHLNRYVEDYNRRAVPYKKIGLLRVREEDFPKNTLRKIMRFKMDMTID